MNTPHISNPQNFSSPEESVAFYSQNGEDYLLWELFKGKTEGFYVDIGAFDGIHFSNSNYFAKHGWKGVCIEAHPKYYPLCKGNRPEAICIHAACVGNNTGSTVTFNAEELGLFSGITSEPLQVISKRYENRNATFSGYTKVEINAITLNDVLQQYAPPNRKIDFISIDTEGNELDILKDFNFQQWNIGVFVVEANDEAHAQPIIRLMRENGYVLARILSMNYFFTREREAISFLRYKKISCQIAAGIHPLGERVTKTNERGFRIDETSRWITPNVLCQQANQPLWSLLDYFPSSSSSRAAKSARIVHLVNPYPIKANTTSGKYQKLTYDSMRVARDFDDGEITLVSVQHQDDEDLTPEGFVRARSLDRVVTDLAKFRRPQPLPLLFDILERGAELASPDDVLVFTNADIILMPFFYSAVRDFIEHGFDAINICRRTIGEHSLYLDHENLACSEVGDLHPGSDCFVFTKKIYDQFVRNNSCIGKQGVAKSLLFNLATTAEQMLVLRNVNLTYHIGDDRDWTSSEVQDYTSFNEQELNKLYQQLCSSQKKKEMLTKFVNVYWHPVNMQG